jgi:hypothetical protein
MLPQWGHLSLATIGSILQILAVDTKDQLMEIHQTANLVNYGNLSPTVARHATITICRTPAAGRARSNLNEFKVAHK